MPVMVMLLAGCTIPAPQDAPTEDASTVTVLDRTGAALAGAQVRWDGGAAITDAEGAVRVPAALRTWVSVEAPGHRAVVRPLGSGEDLTVRMLASEGAQVWRFMGDAMFARRMPERYPHDEPADVAALFDGIRPWLDDADVAVLNMESPITARVPDNPHKEYRFASPPVVAEGLAHAGFDAVDLANNHQYDAMGPGLNDSLDHIDGAGLGRFGAGQDETEAWAPWVSGDGQVAMVGCTTLWGPSGVYSNRADDDLGKGGAAYCEDDGVAAAVDGASAQAPFVVFQVHGGIMYETGPQERVREVAMQAQAAGADLVVGHHPHVFGPVTWDAEGPVAWSLGNVVFDSVIEETWDSGVFTVVVEEGRVAVAYVEPIRLVDYLPVALVGPDRLDASHALAALDADMVVQDALVLAAPA